jgi:hypothetical protein
MVILAEELLLLAYNDDTGRNEAQYLDMGLAGALLLDLVLARRIDLSGKHVEVTNPAPVGHPLLDETLDRINGDHARKPKNWVEKLRHHLARRVLDSLVSQNVLQHDADKVLGFIPFNRYRPVNPSVEADIRARLEHTVARGAAPDDRTAALASMVYALKLEKLAFPHRKKSEVRALLKEITEGTWAADATRKAIQAAQAAINAAITASIASSAAASGGSN